MDDHPLIADHGLIGDLQTAALVTTGGSIDWFCFPRFDSPSVFGSLLDAAGGGHYDIRPADVVFSSKQMYLPDTAILITRFLTEAGVGEIVDLMPISGAVATDRHRLVRIVRCVRGRRPGGCCSSARRRRSGHRRDGSAGPRIDDHTSVVPFDEAA
jgi:GH15 family glucan-1,4-alpha-glucosidase